MLSLVVFALVASIASASVIPGVINRRQGIANSVVNLSYGSFEGNLTGSLVSFLGIPYAAPPIGALRFALPQSPVAFSGIRTAQSYGAACPQTGQGASATISEDCEFQSLFLNVIAPANLPEGTKLPVLFWINGGAFATGDTSVTPGNPIVQRSIDLGEPIVYVSTNYRLNAFGFLGGSELQSAGLGNLGLQDQRFAMAWVQENIASFFGDPTRVIISGESAGAMSVALHLVANGGDPAGLFHGAFMSSGSPNNLKPMSAGQSVYNTILSSAGCASTIDPIACLRGLSLSEYMSAVPSGSWGPSIDGSLITENPWQSIVDGNYAKVPLVTGDVDDEGTKFAEPLTSITTNSQFQSLVANTYFPGATSDQVSSIMADYPSDPTDGSPFNTGSANAITSQYKRVAAFLGDVLFQAPRRFFIQTASQTQSTWAFLYQRGKSTPTLGSYHTSDVPEIYGSAATNDFILTDAFINFVNTLNPTLPSNELSLLTSSGIEWDVWSSSADSPPMLLLTDEEANPSITTDTYRQGPMADLISTSMYLLGLTSS